MKRQHIAFLAIAVMLIGAVLGLAGFRTLIAETLRVVRWQAIAATVPGQVAASLLCAAALFALKPGVSFIACLGSRLLRDGADNVLIFFPGLGEVIGARALVLAGGTTRAAVTASLLDKVAETLAQVPYIALAAWILYAGWQGADAAWIGTWQSVAGALILLILLIMAFRWLRHSQSPLATRLRMELARLREEYHRQKRGMPLCTLLHFIAWVMGGVQIWMAAQAMGLELSFFEAIAIESAAYAGRAILFFVPAGLGTQEAGIIAAGLIFGLSLGQSLAIGLVLRLRDLLFSVVLIAWPLFEWRGKRT